MTSRCMVGSAKAAAIVPAYDEAATVGGVVRALKSAPSISEVIVVDDGSSDATFEAARAAGADRVIRLDPNAGKGEALVRGVAATDAGILLFCDADFVGFTAEQAERLLEPVMSGRLMMCAGLRDRGPFTPLVAALPLISGERALRREVFEAVPQRFLRGFRVELALGRACAENRWPCGTVPTLGVAHVRKTQKRGLLRGVLAYVKMVLQLADALVRMRLSGREFIRHDFHAAP